MYQPFNDTMMVYDVNSHRYILTETALMQHLGVNLDTEFDSFSETDIRQRKKERFLKKVSDTVYGYIYQDTANSLYGHY